MRCEIFEMKFNFIKILSPFCKLPVYPEKGGESQKYMKQDLKFIEKKWS